MKKFTTIVAATLLVFALQGVVHAQNPHFVGQVNFTDLGTQLQATGSIAGLGNQNIDVQLAATGSATTICTNPGGNVAPGQTTTVNLTGSATNLEVKNGRVNFVITTDEPVAPSSACPNARWTPSITDVEFTSATITVFQPAGSGIVVLSQTFQLP